MSVGTKRGDETSKSDPRRVQSTLSIHIDPSSPTVCSSTDIDPPPEQWMFWRADGNDEFRFPFEEKSHFETDSDPPSIHTPPPPIPTIDTECSSVVLSTTRITPLDHPHTQLSSFFTLSTTPPITQPFNTATPFVPEINTNLESEDWIEMSSCDSLHVPPATTTAAPLFLFDFDASSMTSRAWSAFPVVTIRASDDPTLIGCDSLPRDLMCSVVSPTPNSLAIPHARSTVQHGPSTPPQSLFSLSLLSPPPTLNPDDSLRTVITNTDGFSGVRNLV
ncbi:hypothetical protein BLNAU_8225 [Blattamonas nauphoetae]|uniref:Uncharacterized protein n=1 Tax=Blattamonas nauphoetae TaxID=2049346 RepID=A0ABQ9XZ65_9EUKA|nr:hypothetical protein BLNAU_8225 [Blattamonas nauphoetae]